MRWPFGRGRRSGGSEWLSPEAYDALSEYEKSALAARRRLGEGNGGLRRKNPGRTWVKFLPLWAGAALFGTAYGTGWFDGLTAETRVIDPADVAETIGTSPVNATFGFCHTGGGRNCVVDGDTIWLEGQNIRIADIDAPETHEPRCSSEKRLGQRATRRLHELVNSGAVTTEGIGRDSDTYGRKLRIVLVDGTSVGDTLVDEGLARWYKGGRRSWC